MEQFDLLIDKGINVIELKNKGQELRKQWGETFAKDVSYGMCLVGMYFLVKKDKGQEMHLI